jgi:hypothetical protein
MVRKGSPVRVRQRALAKAPLRQGFSSPPALTPLRGYALGDVRHPCRGRSGSRDGTAARRGQPRLSADVRRLHGGPNSACRPGAGGRSSAGGELGLVEAVGREGSRLVAPARCTRGDCLASTGFATRRPQLIRRDAAVVAAAPTAPWLAAAAPGVSRTRAVPERSESVDLTLGSGLGSVLIQQDFQCSEGSGMTEHERATRRRGGLVPLAIGHV